MTDSMNGTQDRRGRLLSKRFSPLLKGKGETEVGVATEVEGEDSENAWIMRKETVHGVDDVSNGSSPATRQISCGW